MIVTAAGERLRYRPTSAVPVDLVGAVREGKDELEGAVAWRAEVKRPQIPASGPPLFLVARLGTAPFPRGRCQSCGDVLGEEQ